MQLLLSSTFFLLNEKSLNMHINQTFTKIIMASKKRLEDYSRTRHRWDEEKGTEYSRIYRHLDYFIKRILESQNIESLTESELLTQTELETGFKINRQTVRKYLDRLQERYRESPLEPFYKVNQGFFERHPAKPPKDYHRERD